MFSDSPSELFPHEKLSKLLFQKWVKEDVESAIEALSSTTDLLGASGLRNNIFSDIVESDPRRGLPLMARWRIYNHGPGTQGVKKWAQKNPQEVATAILEHSAGFGTEHCMEAVAKVWAGIDPKAALAFADDTKAKGNEALVLRETVFREWIAKDMDAASDWMANHEDPDLQDFYRPMVIEAWAKNDPQEALAWCQENLTGADLTKAIAKLAKGAAAADLQSAANLVRELKPGKPQEQATVAVAKKWFPDPYDSNAKIPPQAVEWLRTLENTKVKEAALDEISWSWSAHDPKGFRAFLSEDGNRDLPNSVFHEAVSISVRENPVEALKWASSLTEERSLAISKTAFREWLNMQPDKAAAWFKDLPTGDARRPVMLKSLVWNAAFESQEAIAAEKLRGLSNSERLQARTMVERSRIADERKRRMLKLLNQ